MTDRDAGWVDMEKLRENHVNQTENDVLSSFSVVEAAVREALNTQFNRAKSFAFWSGPVAKDIVLNHNGAEVGLETSALGGLFDGININGKWDGALWAGLSTCMLTPLLKWVKATSFASSVLQEQVCQTYTPQWGVSGIKESF